MSNYAKVGLTATAERASIGWTAPTVIYTKMREIQASAAALNTDIQTNITRAAFKTSWAAWFKEWQAFYEKYQSEWAKLGAVTYTDDLNRQTEGYRDSMNGWFDAYRREKDEKGNPLPPPSGQAPMRPPPEVLDPPKSAAEGFTVPWWGWALGGMAVCGLGYVLYRSYVQTKGDLDRKKNYLESNVVPSLLPGYYPPPQVSPQAVANDPSRAMGYMPPHYPHPGLYPVR